MDVYGTMVSLAACLCAENTECGSPDLCYCGVTPGSVPIDLSGMECDPAGQGWVRLTTATPSNRAGLAEQQPGVLTGLGVGLEVGILRHFPIQSEPLSDEEVTEATEQQITDMMTIYRAITCCDALNRQDYLLGVYSPLGPAGGLVGGQWTLTLSLL